MRSRRLGSAALVAAFLVSGASQAPPRPITALAPIEVVLDGYRELVGVAVGADGTAYVSDRGAGTIIGVSSAGTATILLRGLDRPAGLALDGDGRLLIAEEGGDRILRREVSGTLTTLAAGIKTPRWLALAPAGDIYVSAHRLDETDRLDVEEGRAIVRVDAADRLSVVARGIRRLEGLALVDTKLVAAAKGLESGAEMAGALLRYPVLPDGTLGASEAWISSAVKAPVGVVLDSLGALFVGAKEMGVPVTPSNRVVGKVHRDARVTGFAANLDDPRGTALAPDGSLYVADGKGGRLLRFRAPLSPALAAAPEFTNQRTLTLSGTAEPGARIDVTIEGSLTTTTGVADTAGVFSLPITLTPNTATALSVFATGHAGDGLTSAPTEATVVHDDIRPEVRIIAPAAGAFVRQTVALQANASDTGSGVSSLTFTLGTRTLGTVTNADPTRPLAAQLLCDSRTAADGAYTYAAAARDRAGNVASVGQTLTIDNTPPETTITGGPSGTTSETSATFTFTGADNLTPPESLVFAWRLDDSAWSALGSATTVSFSGLAQGPHTFEVKARDRAGNEATAAVRSFTVASLRVTILEPADGSSVPSGPVLVRGVVESGGAEVGVSVNGLRAYVTGREWAAEVPVTAGNNAIVATAVTLAGGQARATIALSGADVTAAVLLRALPEAGVVPLQVAWRVINQTGRTLVTLQLDDEGTGRFGAPVTTLDGVLTTYSNAGLFTPALRATDDQGQTYLAKTLVHVEDPAAAALRFQRLWGGFTAALRSGDQQAALAHLAPNLQTRFGEVLRQLASDLPSIAAGLGDVHVLGQVGDLAEAALVQTENGVDNLYFVYYRRDARGQWLIEEM